ncbi:hypothetical protein FACS1894199_11440 [Bacteroidia bacterium]|nr:hypothetical protein FACS1894199_11440 [Bacteroidia bacterium]
MTPQEFQTQLNRLSAEFKDFFDTVGPRVIGKVAVGMFKQNFMDEGFFGDKWKDVKRRSDPKNFKTITRGKSKGEVRANAWARRPILAGATGCLRRSIQVKEAANGHVIIWTDPNSFIGSKEPYGRVHNEGLRAGSGRGFMMPKRQFIGDHPKLREAIITELERQLNKFNISIQ